jgi:hypothetical protein
VTEVTEGAERAAPEPAPQGPAEAYGQRLADALTAHQAALQPVGELIVRLEGSPELMTDDAWRGEIEAALESLDGAGAALVDLTPPPEEIPKPALYSWRRARQHLERVGSETRALVGDWRQAIAAGDAEAVQAPRGHLHRIGAARHKALQEVARARAGSRPPG